MERTHASMSPSSGHPLVAGPRRHRGHLLGELPRGLRRTAAAPGEQAPGSARDGGAAGSRFGAGIRRGVIAADHFTQVANALFCDSQLSFKAKGIFGYVSTHRSGWRVTVASVRHVEPYLTCYGFRLDGTAGSFVYSGDSGPSAGMRKLAKGCDILVHMCHYISGTQLNESFAASCMGHMELAELAAEAGVRNLVVSHVTEQFDKPGIRERVIAQMSAVYKGNIYFGEDLLEVPLDAPHLDKLM